MRFRNTLLLLLVLIGLGGYLYFVEVPAAKKEAEKKTVYNFKPDQATAVTLTFADRTIALEKKDKSWKLTKPLQADADDSVVKSLLSTIANCKVKKTLEKAPKDLSAFGLDKPMVTIEVTASGKKLPQLKVGGKTPVGSSAYIERADNQQVLLTDGVFRTNVDKKVKDLRDKSILHFPEDAVRKIELQGNGTDVVLAKQNGHWHIDKPASYGADDNVVTSFVASAHSMRALDFPDETKPASEYGFDSPTLTVTLWVGKDMAEHKVLVGKQNDQKQYYVKTAAVPAVYTIGEWSYKDLNKTANDFRDKTVLAYDAGKVKSIAVKRQGGETFTVVRGANKKWTVEGAAATSREDMISQFAKNVHDLKGYEITADNVTDLKPYGLDNPKLALTITGDDGKPIGTVLLTQHEENAKKEYLATPQGGGTVYRLRDFIYTRVDKTRSDFVRKPTPTATSAAAATPTAKK